MGYTVNKNGGMIEIKNEIGMLLVISEEALIRDFSIEFIVKEFNTMMVKYINELEMINSEFVAELGKY